MIYLDFEFKMKNNRRNFIKLAGMAGLGFTGVNVLPAQAEITGIESNILPEEVLRPFNRSPRMMQDYFLSVKWHAIRNRGKLIILNAV